MGPESYIGSINEFAGHFPVRGWADCDGRLMPIQNYAALFSIIGTTYGGDGVRNFALPDLRPMDEHHIRIDWAQIEQPRIKICIDGIYPPRD